MKCGVAGGVEFLREWVFVEEDFGSLYWYLQFVLLDQRRNGLLQKHGPLVLLEVAI